MDKYVDKAGLQDFATKMNAKQKTIFALKSEVGSPLVAATAADMTDTDKVYVYTGSEAGYTAGNWYYYDGSVWQSGGVYNAIAFTTDTTLSNPGEAADAKVTGDDIRALQSDMANKANIDGSYDTMNVGTAENLTPYSADAGVVQDIAFNMQGAGCGNGETQVDTGTYCQLKEKRGHSVVVNQQLKAINSTNWTAEASVSATFTDGEAVFTSSVAGNGVKTSMATAAAPGHKYLVAMSIKASEICLARALVGSAGSSTSDFSIGTSYAYLAKIITGTSTASGVSFYVYAPSGSTGKQISFKDIICVDLTQWFGSNDLIPAHLLSHPEDFGRYYQGSLAYNVGTLTNADGGVLKTIGRNQWDEQTELGSLNTTTGAKILSNDTIRPKNYIPVIPNQVYAFRKTLGQQILVLFYDNEFNCVPFNVTAAGNATQYNSAAVVHMNDAYTTFQVPAGATSILFRVDGQTAYGNDITISLYYSGESGYDEYYPYEELASINTGSETLRSAGEAYDAKVPDGTITRKVGVKTSQTGAIGDTITISDMKADTQNIVCALGGIDEWGTVSGTTITLTKAITSLDIYYELATATTESGTSYAETVTIDDFGSMQFVNTNGVPQGNLIFYPVDYKAFVDTAYNELDGDATQIAQKGELAVGDPDTIKGVLNLINAKIPAPPASDGAYKLTVTVSSGVATYSWEA